MNDSTPRSHVRIRKLWLPMLAIFVLLLAACQTSPSPPTATPIPPTATPTSAQTAGAAQTPAAQEAPSVGSGETGESSKPGTESFQAVAPLAPADASAPTRLQIPVIGLDAAVEPMGWRVEEYNGVRTTLWVLPELAAGWHPNSALAGAQGNVVISGHQLLGAAVFAPIALGDVEVGQDVLLTDADGRTFVYRITQVTEPQPITDDLAQEEALAAQYTAQSDEALLTLVSGWPDYTSTHRVFVIAAFMGVAP